MKIGDLIRFHDERFFDGAVQLRWVETQPEKARQAAQAFVFHGPRYHGANNDGIDEGYRLKDSVSFVRDLLHSLQAGWRGAEENPYWMVVAGYGSGKSHLALTCAVLLGKKDGVTESVLKHIEQADADLGAEVREQISHLAKPVLILPLDGMAGFHLGNALSQAVFAQFRRYGVDAAAIRDLSPRFQTAEQFVQRNFDFRADSFAQHFPGLDVAAICALLRDNDEEIYSAVDVIYTDANGSPIPVTGQESAQELINTLCEVYCGPDGVFSSVVILFDEFGRYLEYAAEKPRLAGDAALQQIFQGVQDNNSKVRLVGFIQYELKAYLKRFGSADLRQLQRYITRFDTAKKWYLSTNLETIFANMIGKKETELAPLLKQAEKQWQMSWRYLSQSLPEFHRFPVWSDFEQFSRVIGQGCWPLHPLATWFLTRQRDVVQSRSALTFIKDIVEHVADEDASNDSGLRQISAAELVLKSLLSELIAAERETGATTAETLQVLLEKFKAHLNPEQQRVLAGVAVLTKMRVGKQNQDVMDRLISEATALESGKVSNALRVLGQELGALEWNGDLGQYELIADAASRGQFQQWLRKKQAGFTVDAVRDLFIRRGAKDSELGSIESDFGHHRDIRTTEWVFEAQFAHISSIESTIQRVFREWEEATAPNEAKGRVIYLYLHADDDLASLQTKLHARLQAELQRSGHKNAPIWIIAIVDSQGAIAEHIGRLEIFDESSPEDIERFRRFIPDERERSRLVLREATQAAIKERVWWVAGITEPTAGRLKIAAESIFGLVYPDALPFPFDGFASGPGGPADAAQLIRHLATGQVDGNWVQTQPVRLRNRVQAVLVNSWRALLADGRLVAPSEVKVKVVYNRLLKTHQDQPTKTLWSSYRALIAPPYGMNASSAGMLLSLLLGGSSPPRRIEQSGEMVATGDWIATAVHPQHHHFKKESLEKSTIRFLSEDADSRWRSLLDRWESEENYQKTVDLSRKAERMRRDDPLPESLEGRYGYLRDKAVEIANIIDASVRELGEWEIGIEKAARHNDLGKLLKIGSALVKRRDEFLSPNWLDADVEACDKLLGPVLELVAQQISDWIPRQSCNTVTQVSEYRYRMAKAVASLNDLAFHREAQILETQSQRAIMKVEERQRYSLTLAESDDYPRQPEPSDSTPLKDLRNSISRGDRLIDGIQAASTALTGDEVAARIKAIQSRQVLLKAMVERHRTALGILYKESIASVLKLKEIHSKVSRLHSIFIDTPDADGILDLLIQLDRIESDISAWDIPDSLSPERMSDILQQHVKHQLKELDAFLEAKNIDPAWNMEGIYLAIANEFITARVRRSAEWIKPRMFTIEDIKTIGEEECIERERELMNLPSFLAADDREMAEHVLSAIKVRLLELDEDARLSQVAEWQQTFLNISDFEHLDKYETEQLLNSLLHPPVNLRPAELAIIEPIRFKLISHFDEISLEEIIGRIERLSVEHQRQLLSFLSSMLLIH